MFSWFVSQPTSSIFLLHQISISHQSFSNIFILQQININYQPKPAEQSNCAVKTQRTNTTTKYRGFTPHKMGMGGKHPRVHAASRLEIQEDQEANEPCPGATPERTFLHVE
jgi:hypothetical protein